MRRLARVRPSWCWLKAWITWAAYQLQIRDYCRQCDRIYWRWRYWPHRHAGRCVVVETGFGRLLTTADAMDDLIEQWHDLPADHPRAGRPLHEFLGMSWEQYKAWVEGR